MQVHMLQLIIIYILSNTISTIVADDNVNDINGTSNNKKSKTKGSIFA